MMPKQGTVLEVLEQWSDVLNECIEFQDVTLQLVALKREKGDVYYTAFYEDLLFAGTIKVEALTVSECYKVAKKSQQSYVKNSKEGCLNTKYTPKYFDLRRAAEGPIPLTMEEGVKYEMEVAYQESIGMLDWEALKSEAKWIRRHTPMEHAEMQARIRILFTRNDRPDRADANKALVAIQEALEAYEDVITMLYEKQQAEMEDFYERSTEEGDDE